MQRLQLYSWFDAELVNQDPAGLPVGGERLPLSAAPAQRGHELSMKPFPDRLLRNQLPKLEY